MAHLECTISVDNGDAFQREAAAVGDVEDARQTSAVQGCNALAADPEADRRVAHELGAVESKRTRTGKKNCRVRLVGERIRDQ